MTLPRSRMTTLFKSDSGHSYIETCLLLAGSSAGSVTTNVATAGPTQEATGKIIDLQNYVSKQLMK
jgi:hypothetical protein